MSAEELSNLQVYLGDYKLHSVSDGPLITRKVSRVIYHREFDDQTLVSPLHGFTLYEFTQAFVYQVLSLVFG
jgi:hypothetical protein